MAIDTSVSPYFDDYTEDKNFYKVLYKPGVAIQSRELNQTQTIFQNQIKRIGDYLYTDGQKVTGTKPSVNLDARTVRILDRDATGASIDVTQYLNKYVTSENTDIVGLVEFVFEKNNPDIGDLTSIVISLKRFNGIDNGKFPEKDTLYFYDSLTDALNNIGTTLTAVVEQNIIKNSLSSTSTFSKTVILSNPTSLIEVGDLLVHPAITKDVYVTNIVSPIEIELDVAPGVSIGGENIQYTKLSTCPTSIVTQDVAYFYKNGYLVRSNLQKLVPDKNTGSPSKAIGLFVTEEIVTSADDATLLDPAIGSSNYFAPGADRLRINLSLASFDLTTDKKASTTENIIPLLTFNKGEIEYVAEIDSATEIRKELEQRTYDESGNYVVKDFVISPIATYDNDPDLRFTVSGGKAYIGGKQVVTTSSTEIAIPKPITTDTKTGFNITTTQGNYLRITDVNIQGGNEMIIPKPETLTQGEIYLELHNVTNPTAANAANTRVGTLVFKNLEYDSSFGPNAVTQLKLFYHNLSLSKEAPATWEAWSIKYGITVADGQYIANVLYSSNVFLGNYGVASTPCYTLFREPGVDEVAYWFKQWALVDGKDIAKTKKRFAESILSDSTTTDYARLTTSGKTYYQVINGSPFSDGLVNANKVRSVIGVNNSSTSHYTTATYSAPFFYANISSQGLDATGSLSIIDPRPSDALVFPIGTKQYLKNLKNIRTTYSRVIRNAIFNSGVYVKTLSYPESFPLGDGTIVASTARTNFIVSVKSGSTSAVKNGIFNFESGAVTISADSTIASIDTGDPSFTGLADIEFLVQSDNLTPRIKTLVTDVGQFVNVTTPQIDYSLKISDIAGFIGIYKLTDTTSFKGAWSPNVTYDYNQHVLQDGTLYKAISPSSNVSTINANTWSLVNTAILSNFVISNGQKDGWYDHGYIRYIGPTASVPGNVLVAYDYFTHNGDGPCTVDSYPASYYSQIDTYKSVIDSKEYTLRDCLDFRPKRTNGSNYLNFDTAVFPTSFINTEADVTYYLGRIDRLYISKNAVSFDSPYNRLFVESGVEANSPDTKIEIEDQNRLAIATITIPPYTTSAFDVLIEYEDNKRFTMRDIAKLEKTTIALDKQVRIHSVEIANLQAQVVNDNGDTLLKSGILVENFADFSKADLENSNYNIAISTSEGTCGPLYSAHQVSMQLTAASNYSMYDDLITAKYSEEIFLSQTEANDFINPNPGGIDDRRGKATLAKRNSFNLNLFQWGLIATGVAIAGVSAYVYATSTATIIASIAQGATVVWNVIQAGWVLGSAGISYVATALTNVVVAGAEAVASWAGLSTASLTFATAIPYVAIAVAVYLVVDAIAPAVTKFVKDVVKGAVNLVKEGVKEGKRLLNEGAKWIKSWFSDVEMKENIVFVQKLHAGINIYRYEYKQEFKHLDRAGPGVYYGVLAHEVEKVYPNAVTLESNGYKSVDYSLIGINRTGM